MKLLTFIILSMIAGIAPTLAQGLEGTYRLQGGPEMAAEFHFARDGRFAFAFAYGAVDREAEGSYTLDNGLVVLNSSKTPGKDFTVKHRERRGEGFTVRISDPNPWLTRHVMCLFKKGDQFDQQFSDDDNIVHSKWTECDSIFVVHALYPDAMTLVKDADDRENNYFELGLSSSLVGVSFKGVRPRLDGDTIVVEMPWLFEGKEAVFVKVGP